MLGKQLISGAEKTGYDVTKFTYIARVGAEPYSLIVGKNSRFHTLEDLQKAKRVKWGVEGIGVSRWIPTFVAAGSSASRWTWCRGTAAPARAYRP